MLPVINHHSVIWSLYHSGKAFNGACHAFVLGMSKYPCLGNTKIAIRIRPAWGPHIATSRLYAATAISPPARFTCRLRLPVAYDALIIFTILRRQVPFSWSSKPHSSLGRNSLQWPHRDAVLIITIVATSVTRLGPPGSCVAREPGRLSFALRRHHPSLGRRGLRQHRPALPWRLRSESDPTKRMK